MVGPRTTPKQRTTVDFIHPASQRPPPPLSQWCVSATIAHVSHVPVTACMQGGPLSQHRASALADSSNDQCPRISLLHSSPPNQRLVGRLAHSTSLPSEYPHLHPNVTSQLPTHALSLHSNHSRQRTADSPSHPSDIEPPEIIPTHIPMMITPHTPCHIAANACT